MLVHLPLEDMQHNSSHGKDRPMKLWAKLKEISKPQEKLQKLIWFKDERFWEMTYHKLCCMHFQIPIQEFDSLNKILEHLNTGKSYMKVKIAACSYMIRHQNNLWSTSTNYKSKWTNNHNNWNLMPPIEPLQLQQHKQFHPKHLIKHHAFKRTSFIRNKWG